MDFTATECAQLNAVVTQARFKLALRKPLDETEAGAIILMLESLLKGHDPRSLIGVAPARGAPPVTEPYQNFIAAHYWALRSLEPSENDLVARKLVAQAWSISDSYARQIATKKRKQAKVMLSAILTTIA